MKILFYINILGCGGAERVICNLATEFSKHHHECIIATSFSIDNEYNVGDNVQRISLFSEELNLGFWVRNYRLTRKLRKIIKSEKPDVVVAFMAEPNFRAIISSIGLRNKVIVSVRNDPRREYPNIINRILAKLLFKFADGIVFQTEDAKKWFPSDVQKKSEIIYNQVDSSFYNMKFEGNRHDIVTVGRLETQKNHKMLICAFAAIADNISDNLFIYGEGGLRNDLETLISELHMQNRIFLQGRTDNVAEVIKSAKLFILSSDYEGMPNSLMEAMALGVPCLSTDCPCGGPKMLFGELLADRLYTCNDTKELSEKIKKMIVQKNDGKDEKRLSDEFRPEVIFRKWEEYLMRICDKNGG